MIADPYVWHRPSVKLDGEQYYEYVLVYVDNVLAINFDAKQILGRSSVG